jgi:hypothetical protein
MKQAAERVRFAQPVGKVNTLHRLPGAHLYTYPLRQLQSLAARLERRFRFAAQDRNRGDMIIPPTTPPKRLPLPFTEAYISLKSTIGRFYLRDKQEVRSAVYRRRRQSAAAVKREAAARNGASSVQIIRMAMDALPLT